MSGKELMIKLCDSFGISGNETELHETLRKYFGEFCEEFRIGTLGDFTAIKRGSGNGSFKIMLAAHADEVGLMVRNIDERGFIGIVNVSGVDPKTLPAQEVIIHGKQEVFGVIGAKPPHVLSEEDMKKAVKMEELLIDVGMTREEAAKLISVGDFISMNRKSACLTSEYVTAKALDNRCSIAALYECGKELCKMQHAGDVYFTMTSQEERGHHGARVSAYEINPDLGIAVDVDFGDRYAYSDAVSECGKGIEISVGPTFHNKLSQKLMEISDKYNIHYEIDVTSNPPGTDGEAIQISREGIPTGLISIPLRYMHTSTEVVNYKDVLEAGKLLALFIANVKDWGDIIA